MVDSHIKEMGSLLPTQMLLLSPVISAPTHVYVSYKCTRKYVRRKQLQFSVIMMLNDDNKEKKF